MKQKIGQKIPPTLQNLGRSHTQSPPGGMDFFLVFITIKAYPALKVCCPVAFELPNLIIEMDVLRLQIIR